MTEKATLRCAHGQELFVGKVRGVFHYTHPDGSGCGINNSLVVSAEKILEVFGVREHDANPTMRAAFTCSLSYRLRCYDEMSRMKGEEVVQALRRISVLIDGAHNEQELAWELEKIFGKVVWVNMEQVSQTVYAASQKAPAKPYPLPKYSMINVLNEREDATFLSLDDAVTRSDKRAGMYHKR